MTNFLENFLIEIALFSVLGVLYYFYQKRKIDHFEENKYPLVMNFILQSCLSEKKDSTDPELDSVIVTLDDFLQNRLSSPPIVLLKYFINSPNCSEELRDVIVEGLAELGEWDGKE